MGYDPATSLLLIHGCPGKGIRTLSATPDCCKTSANVATKERAALVVCVQPIILSERNFEQTPSYDGVLGTHGGGGGTQGRDVSGIPHQPGHSL